jgi:hypothetical protein
MCESRAVPASIKAEINVTKILSDVSVTQRYQAKNNSERQLNIKQKIFHRNGGTNKRELARGHINMTFPVTYVSKFRVDRKSIFFQLFLLHHYWTVFLTVVSATLSLQHSQASGGGKITPETFLDVSSAL